MNTFQTTVQKYLQTSKDDTMDRNKIDLELLAVAEDIEGLYIHHQPKKSNRRWGVRREDFKANSTAWVEPKIASNEFVIKPTGDFKRFTPQLESIAQRIEQNQNRTAYYFKLSYAMKVFEILRPHK